jgi:hypothetical protein
MPRGAAKGDYANGKIYRLVATGTDAQYIGSTCGVLNTRLWYHNHAASHPGSQKQCSASSLYESGRTVAIELIELFPCTTKAELLERERYWLEQTPTAVNQNTPGGLGWREARARRQAEHDAYMIAYRAQEYTCECGVTLRRADKARHERSQRHITYLP